ncbi:RsmD family RNA methyltransferase, partial [Staphylococcus aureus]
PGATVRAAPVAAVVSGPSAREYDIVIADPPYAVTDEAVVSMLTDLQANKWVGEGTIVVLERSSRSPETVWPQGYEPIKAKNYGEARI